MPLGIAQRSNEHLATLLREMALVDASDAVRSAARRRLENVATEVREKYARFADAPRATAEAAAAAGQGAVDLRYDVPVEFARDAELFANVLSEVDHLCRSGELLTLVAPDDVVAFRDWVLRQFVGQVREGASPEPWSDDLVPASRPRESTGEIPRTKRLVLGEDLDLEGAARIRDEIATLLDTGTTHLVIDVAQCGFIDSVGISLLLTTYSRLREAGGSLRVVAARDSVRRTLRQAGIADLLLGD